jgi:hypothetical protein
MAATATLAQATFSGTANIGNSVIGQAPYNGSFVPTGIATLTFSAGTTVNFSPTVPQLAQFPTINTILAAANANHTITLPLPSLTPGMRFRITRGDPLVARTIVINVTGNVAGAFNGQILQNAVTAVISLAAVSVGFSATAVLGDWIELQSNGVVYNVIANSAVAAGIAIA